MIYFQENDEDVQASENISYFHLRKAILFPIFLFLKKIQVVPIFYLLLQPIHTLSLYSQQHPSKIHPYQESYSDYYTLQEAHNQEQ